MIFPFLRIGAFAMTAPVFGARFVPSRIRLMAALAFTLLAAPLVSPPGFAVFSTAGLGAVASELAIGAIIGFLFSLVFDALVLAAEFLSLSIGLGFAQLADPARGAPTVVLGQFYMITAVLLFLAEDGHLMLLRTLVHSFDAVPVGTMPTAASFDSLARLGAFVFAGALAFALPALVAMLCTNLAYAVISRAAPALNLFAVGFPFTLLFGMALMLLTIGLLPLALQRLVIDARHAVSLFLVVP